MTDTVKLADGTDTSVVLRIGDKGIPTAMVLSQGGPEEIDLLPWGWLQERWCKVTWGDGLVFVTPRGRAMNLKTWQGMPYLTKPQLTMLFEDLPNADIPGRSGHLVAMMARVDYKLGSTVRSARVKKQTPGPTGQDTGMVTPSPRVTERARKRECRARLSEQLSHIRIHDPDQKKK